MKLHNEEALYQLHSKENPVANIRAQHARGKTNARMSHFDDDNGVPSTLKICHGARVFLSGKNVCTKWGLYNGTIGTVVDIVYGRGESPNTYHLPKYVLVRFESYTGPSLLPGFDPKLVAIAPIELKCQNFCCTRIQLPLQLSFGKTIHKLQGISIGPTPEGCPNNSADCIIIDPGQREIIESLFAGIMYTALSRATTLGSDENNNLDGALFFTGPDVKKSRFYQMWKTRDGLTYKNIQRRNKWMEILDRGELKYEISSERKQELKNWITDEPKISTDDLDAAISNMKAR